MAFRKPLMNQNRSASSLAQKVRAHAARGRVNLRFFVLLRAKKARTWIAIDRRGRYYASWMSSALSQHNPRITECDLHWKNAAIKKHLGGVDE